MVVLAVAMIGSAGFIMGRGDGGSAVTATRLFLGSWVLGMVGYSLYGIGAVEALERFGEWGALIAGVLGGFVPLLVYATVGRLIKRRQAGQS